MKLSCINFTGRKHIQTVTCTLDERLQNIQTNEMLEAKKNAQLELDKLHKQGDKTATSYKYYDETRADEEKEVDVIYSIATKNDGEVLNLLDQLKTKLKEYEPSKKDKSNTLKFTFSLANLLGRTIPKLETELKCFVEEYGEKE